MWFSSSLICSHLVLQDCLHNLTADQKWPCRPAFFTAKIKKAMESTPMAFIMKRQKSHGDQPAHPWLPVTIRVGLGAWMSPAKEEEKVEKEIR